MSAQGWKDPRDSVPQVDRMLRAGLPPSGDPPRLLPAGARMPVDCYFDFWSSLSWEEPLTAPPVPPRSVLVYDKMKPAIRDRSRWTE